MRLRFNSFVLLLALAFAGSFCAAQIGSLNSAGQSSVVQARTIHGMVINALTGTGIARALVSLNTRQVLTDARGRFEFPQCSESSANLVVMRPGFTGGATGQPAQRLVTNLDAEIQLKLYPDALVTGVVSGSDGLPLPQVQVQLQRSNDGPGIRWSAVAFAVTNSRGEYRMLTPGGKFRLSTVYNARLRETGETVLPLTFPEVAGTGNSFALAPGAERHIDLRPHTGASYPVSLTVDQPEVRGGMRFTVVQSDGSSFSPSASGGGPTGEYRLELPAGSYVVHGHLESRDESIDGTAKVTVPGHAVSGIVMHLTPATSLPVELRAEPSSSPTSNNPSGLTNVSASTVDPRQLNLYLKSAADQSSDFTSQDLNLRLREDKGFEFRVPAGRYRLESRGLGMWFVTAATYGITDLLTGEIVIGPGSAGQPIRLAVSSRHGRVRGRVALESGLEGGWVYLFPRQASLVPLAPIYVTGDGTFVSWLPVGSYQAIAVDSQIQDDVSDPEVQERFSAGAKTVEITLDAETVLDLTVQRLPEPHP